MSSVSFFGVRLSGCILTLALLGGCGFTPVYGDHQHAAVPGSLPQIKVAQIPDHLGVVLTNRLRDAFDPTASGPTPQYQLVVKLANTNSSFATRPDGTAAWTDVLIKADWHLENIADGKPITEGSASATTGYSMSNDGYANVVSQSADEMRDIDQLAFQIQDQVALYFKTGASSAIAQGAEPPPAPMAAVIAP